tara:strand:- start:118 stop:486 length:369 start_codon:yes stop_codon:yes gene_type:complete
MIEFTHKTHAVCEVGTTATTTVWEVVCEHIGNDDDHRLNYQMQAKGSDGRYYEDLLTIDRSEITKIANDLSQHCTDVVVRIGYRDAFRRSLIKEALQGAFAMWCKNNLEETDPEQFFMNVVG